MNPSEIASRRPRSILVLVLAAAALLMALVGIPGTVDASPSEPPVDPASVPTVDPNAPELAYATVQGTGERVAYDVVGDMAIIEHDILLGTHAEVQADGIEPFGVAAPAGCDPGLQCGVIDTSSRRKWQNGVVPYTFAAGTSSSAVANIQAAIDHWEQNTPIRFVARTNQSDYVEFVGTGNGNTCSSYLGRVGGRQPINYSGTGRGCLVHEIGHAMGLSHEQNRNDRDQYITIDYTNISGNAVSQFRIATGSTDVGQYDFNSVMHYSAYSFALDRSRPVIIPKDGRDPRSIGSQGVLTDSDVQAIEYVYGGTVPPPTTTTTTTAPTTTTAAPTTTTTAPTTTTTAPTTTTTAPTTTTTGKPTTTTTVRPPTTTTVRPPTTTTVRPPTTTTVRPPTTTTVRPPTTAPTTTPATTVPETTVGPPTTGTTVPPTTGPPTTSPETTVPTTAPTTTKPKGNQAPVLEFTNVADGDTIRRRISYGGINVRAHDPDVGTDDGDGIRWVTLVLSDSETGRFLGARREYRETYDWGLRLRRGRNYTLTAYAVSNRAGGRGWSSTSINVSTK